jgi:hypothetical protein
MKKSTYRCSEIVSTVKKSTASMLEACARRKARQDSPTLANRAESRLARAGRADLDVDFVSLSGGGRGQLAAALTSLLSGGQVAVHSVATAAEGIVDPAVRTAIEELGVDTDEAFVRPAATRCCAPPTWS